MSAKIAPEPGGEAAPEIAPTPADMAQGQKDASVTPASEAPPPETAPASSAAGASNAASPDETESPAAPVKDRSMVVTQDEIDAQVRAEVAKAEAAIRARVEAEWVAKVDKEIKPAIEEKVKEEWGAKVDAATDKAEAAAARLAVKEAPQHYPMVIGVWWWWWCMGRWGCIFGSFGRSVPFH